MHAVAQQQRTGMVSGSMAKGGIGITASPGQDGSAINDEITNSDESRLDCMQDSQHKERLIQAGSRQRTVRKIWGAGGETGPLPYIQRSHSYRLIRSVSSKSLP